MYHIITEVERRGMPTDIRAAAGGGERLRTVRYPGAALPGCAIHSGHGRCVGLKQTWWYDGRRDVVESTRRGPRLLKALHDESTATGCWRSPRTTSARAGVERAIATNASVGRPTDSGI